MSRPTFFVGRKGSGSIPPKMAGSTKMEMRKVFIFLNPFLKSHIQKSEFFTQLLVWGFLIAMVSLSQRPQRHILVPPAGRRIRSDEEDDSVVTLHPLVFFDRGAVIKVSNIPFFVLAVRPDFQRIVSGRLSSISILTPYSRPAARRARCSVQTAGCQNPVTGNCIHMQR